MCTCRLRWISTSSVGSLIKLKPGSLGSFSFDFNREGISYFAAGVTPGSELSQTVGVSSYQSDIDGPAGLAFVFFGYTQSFPQSPTDTTEIRVEYQNVAGTVSK